MVSVNFICIDSASVCFTPYVLRKMFKNIAVIGHIYVHYHQQPSMKHEDPIVWFSRGSQTCWLSIREWNDTNQALKIINELKKGKSRISTSSNNGFIEFEATDVEDMTRFPIDVHSLPSKKSIYAIDKDFDTLKPNYRKYSQNQYKKEKTISISLSLIHPDLLDNSSLIDDKDDFETPPSYNQSSFEKDKTETPPSDEPYVIDMFHISVDFDDLDNYNAHKRQKTHDSEMLVYNVYKYNALMQIE